MSRASATNDAYTLAFGVDHTPMGCFFQLYEKAAKGEQPEGDDEERPQIEGDEQFGIRINNPKTLERNPKLAKVFGNKAPGVLDPENKIKSSISGRDLRSEETVIAIGEACGLDVRKKVFELWD